MKNTIYALFAAMLLAGAAFTGCGSSSDKADATRRGERDSNGNMVESTPAQRQTTKTAIQQFKIEAAAKIKSYEKSISEFKARLSNENKDTRADYEKKLAGLEQKNSDMKKDLEGYTEEAQDKWESFKTGFVSNLDDLGNSISHFFSNEDQHK